MIYPKFLRENSTIGICAPSAGISKRKEKGFDLSLSNLRKNRFNIYECDKVRTENYPSNTKESRAEDFNFLIKNPQIDMIMCATGGDFLIETLPFIDYDGILRNPKWLQGYSDITSLLYSITTRLDIATIYGCNAGGFDMSVLHKSLENNLKLIKGDIIMQSSFESYESTRNDKIDGYNLDKPVEWKALNGAFEAKGRLLGGCFECIQDILGTPFDGTREFIERYREDGIIWYFDVFAMNAEIVFNSLWKMKQMGLFENARAFMFGRVLFPNTDVIGYEEAILRALGDEKVVFNADIGHVNPKMTMINGAFAHIKCGEGKGELELKLI